MIKEQINITLKNKCGLIQCSRDILRIIREKFSVPNPSYASRKFSPRKYIITPSGAFEVGLFHEIRTFIDSLDVPIDVNISEEFTAAFSPDYKSYPLESIDGFTYYDYQENTIRTLLDNGRGIGLLATAAGKSLVIGGLVKSIITSSPTHKILIIVPNTSLLNQLYHSFLEEFNLPIITRWGDGYTPDWDASVLIANSQMLVSDVQYSVDKLRDYNCVIVDEVHRLGEKTNQISKVVHNINTFNKFGLTGTLPDNLLASWNVVGKIGPILYNESSFDIRAKGTASEVQVKIIICAHDGVPDKPLRIGNTPLLPTAFYNKEREFVYSAPNRNEIIDKLAYKSKGNVLILVDTIEYGLLLLDKLTNNGNDTKQVFFIRGETTTTERQRILTLMEESDEVVGIAMSQIFSTGISVKNLPTVIFTSIGKSTVKILQSIGRVLRLHHNKTIATIYDIADSTEYSMDHLKQRIKLYKKEQIPFEVKKIKV